MNPYYATGFFSALVFWVWPVYYFKNLDANAVTVAFFAALLFIGAGRAASEFHIRVLAPKAPPRGPASGIAMTCALIVGLGLLTRVAYHFYLGAN
jgi:hypothetical protein